MGVSAIRVLAIPAAVYCTASSDAPTPTNGPKMVVSTAATIPLPSCNPLRNGANPSRSVINTANPIMPATQRKKLAWNGNSHPARSVVSDA